MRPLLLFLLAIFAVYVGTVQAGFSALMRLSLRISAERAGRTDALGKYLEDPSRLFIATRLLQAAALILSGELIAQIVGVTSADRFGLVFALLFAFAILCEHLLPWLIVRNSPQVVLEALLPSFGWIAAALTPITRPLSALAERKERPSAEEIDALVPSPNGETAVTQSGEHQLLRSIFGFGDRLVREVMTPRPDIVAIESGATLAELQTFFREQEYSRIPVFKDDLDNVLGFVFVKDLIKRGELPPETPVTELMRPAYFVPETKRVPEMLKEFQLQQIQSAVVVDEYGGTAGLVTVEDLLEELVGEIRDEYDVEAEPITQESDDTFVVAGRVGVDQVSERLGVAIEGEGFETFGGYLLSNLGRVPLSGERFEVDELDVEVLEADRRRVQRVRVRKHQPVKEEA